nr:DUF2326 domain-containing protein [Micromonospora sp. DSM 115978]
QHDLRDNLSRIRDATVAFEEFSRQMYGDRSGLFIVDTSENGPRFEISIDGERSKGITNILTYCFDLTLARVARSNERAPDFLVHDSHIFDGVDSRQIYAALRAGSEESDRLNSQHLVTLNSDTLPSGTGEFDPSEFVLPVVLTDRFAEGGLFGMRFE